MNPKNAVWYAGGGLAPVLPVGAGNVFFVNGGSDGPVVDTNDGLTPDSPKQLLQSGIDLCSNDNNDVVVVLNYGANARAVETFPIEVNKSQIHIIGVGNPAQKWPLVSVLAPAGADTAKPALLITADRVEVCGLNLGGGDTAGAIHVGDAGGTWGTWIHDCFFGVEGTGQDGIRVAAATAAPYLTVTDCRFDIGLTRDGVRFDANATRCRIGLPGNGNVFTNLTGVAINVAFGVTEPGIFSNRIAIPANTAGAAITLAAGVLDAIIDDNRANFGDTDMGNNPYADGAAAGANNWLLNYKGITAVLPS